MNFSNRVTIETLLGNEEIFHLFFFCYSLFYLSIASTFVDFSALVAVSIFFFPPQPSVNAEVDMAVLAALPQSMQLDILAQVRF